jgi:hypothetical protein
MEPTLTTSADEEADGTSTSAALQSEMDYQNTLSEAKKAIATPFEQESQPKPATQVPQDTGAVKEAVTPQAVQADPFDTSLADASIASVYGHQFEQLKKEQQAKYPATPIAGEWDDVNRQFAATSNVGRNAPNKLDIKLPEMTAQEKAQAQKAAREANEPQLSAGPTIRKEEQKSSLASAVYRKMVQESGATSAALVAGGATFVSRRTLFGAISQATLRTAGAIVAYRETKKAQEWVENQLFTPKQMRQIQYTQQLDELEHPSAVGNVSLASGLITGGAGQKAAMKELGAIVRKAGIVETTAVDIEKAVRASNALAKKIGITDEKVVSQMYELALNSIAKGKVFAAASKIRGAQSFGIMGGAQEEDPVEGFAKYAMGGTLIGHLPAAKGLLEHLAKGVVLDNTALVLANHMFDYVANGKEFDPKSVAEEIVAGAPAFAAFGLAGTLKEWRDSGATQKARQMVKDAAIRAGQGIAAAHKQAFSNPQAGGVLADPFDLSGKLFGKQAAEAQGAKVKAPEAAQGGAASGVRRFMLTQEERDKWVDSSKLGKYDRDRAVRPEAPQEIRERYIVDDRQRAIDEARKQIANSEAQIADWSSRVYKKTDNRYDAKDMYGEEAGTRSVSAANERRRNNVISGHKKAIKDANELIKDYEKDVADRVRKLEYAEQAAKEDARRAGMTEDQLKKEWEDALFGNFGEKPTAPTPAETPAAEPAAKAPAEPPVVPGVTFKGIQKGGGGYPDKYVYDVDVGPAGPTTPYVSMDITAEQLAKERDRIRKSFGQPPLDKTPEPAPKAAAKQSGELFTPAETPFNLAGERAEPVPESAADAATKARQAAAQRERQAQDLPNMMPDAKSPNVIADFNGNPIPTIEIPVGDITLSKDVPNFKEGANEKGVVEPLRSAKYDRLGTPPIVVWERLDGTKEVITGRHRFDLAQRTGEKTIPAQVVRESDGFTKAWAGMFDAENNIRDGKGSVKDYANYFKNLTITEEEASSRGLLDGDKGRKGYAIGKYAGPDLYAAFSDGEINADKAAVIAEQAPNNPGLQRAGMARAKEKSAEALEAYLKAVKADMGTQAPSDAQMDLFGENNAWQIRADKLSDAAAAKQRELRNEQNALLAARRAGRDANAKQLEKYGFKPGDADAIQSRIKELDTLIDDWKHWDLRGKMDELKQLAGITPEPSAAAPVSEPARPRVEVKSPLDNLSTDKQERAKQLQARLRQLTMGRTSMAGLGFDPEILTVGAELAKLHIEGGVKTFQQFATNMKADLGDAWDKVKTHLHAIWQAAGANDSALDDVSRKDAQKIIADIDNPPAKPQDQPQLPMDVPPPERTTGISHAEIAGERTAEGKEQREKMSILPKAQRLAAAQQTLETNRESITALVDEMHDSGRAVSNLAETSLLHVELVKRRQERDAFGKMMDAAPKDSPERDAAEQQYWAASEAVEKVRNVFDRSGSMQGEMFRERQDMIFEDFSLAEQRSKMERAAGRKLSEKEVQQLGEITEKYAKVKEQLDAERQKRKELEETAKNSTAEKELDALRKEYGGLPKNKMVWKIAEDIVVKWEKEAEEAYAELRILSGRASSGVDPTRIAAIVPLAKIARAALGRGALTFAEWSAQVIEKAGPEYAEILETAWERAKQMIASEAPKGKAKPERAKSEPAAPKEKKEKVPLAPDQRIEKAHKEISEKIADGEQDIGGQIKEIVRAIVAENPNMPTEEIWKRAHEEVSEFAPKMSLRDVRDAFTDYGDWKELKDKSAIASRVRQIRTEGQLESKIEDVKDPATKHQAKRTGKEREGLSDRSRELTRELNEEKKKNPVDETDHAFIATAQQTIGRALQNRIADLKIALATGKRIARRTGKPEDNEANAALRAEKDVLQKMYDDAFPREPITPEERLARAKVATEKAIELTEKQLADLQAGKDLPIAERAKLITDNDFVALRERLTELRATRDYILGVSGKTDKISALLEQLQSPDLGGPKPERAPGKPKTLEQEFLAGVLSELQQRLAKARDDAGLNNAAREDAFQRIVDEKSRRVKERDVAYPVKAEPKADTPRMQRLREIEEGLDAEIQKIRDDTGLTAERKIAQSIAAAERAEQQYQSQAAGVKKDNAGKKPEVWSQELDQAVSARDAARQYVQELRDISAKTDAIAAMLDKLNSPDLGGAKPEPIQKPQTMQQKFLAEAKTELAKRLAKARDDAGMNDAARNKAQVAALKDSIAKLNQRLLGVESPDVAGSKRPITPEIAELLAFRDSLSETVRETNKIAALLEKLQSTDLGGAKPKRAPVDAKTTENQFLVDVRAELQRKLAKARDDAGLNDEARDAAQIKALDAAITRMYQELGPTPPEKTITRERPANPEVEARKQLLDVLKQARKDIIKAKAGYKSPEQLKREAWEDRKRAKLAEVKSRIAALDVAPRTSREPFTPDDKPAQKLAYELDEVQAKLADMQNDYLLSRRGLTRKLADAFGVQLPGMAQSLVSSMPFIPDISVAGNQAKWQSFAHPIDMLRRLPAAARAYYSPVFAHAELQAIKSRPNAPYYSRAKLPFNEEHKGWRSQNEAYPGEWGKLVPYVKWSARSTASLINRTRADAFDNALEYLLRKSGQKEPTKDQLEAITKYVMRSTGHGDWGAGVEVNKGVGAWLYSPRNFLANIQMFAQPFQKDPHVRVFVAKEMTRAIALQAAIGMALLSWLGWKWGDDYLKTDFTKWTKNNTFLAPFGRMAATAVLAARLITGKKRSKEGKESFIRGATEEWSGGGKMKYGQDTGLDLASRYFSNALSPFARGIVDKYLIGENFDGNPMTYGRLALNLVTPMNIPDIINVYEDLDIPEATAASLLWMTGIGGGVQQEKKKATSPSNILPRLPSPPSVKIP